MRGTILKSTGSFYTVRTDDGRKLECRIKGKLRIEGFRATNPVAVGDRVEVETGQSLVTSILPRKNCIIRRATKLSHQSHILACNIDQAILLVTLEAPKTSFGFIDRFLATCEAYRIPSVLIFNKADIFEDGAELEEELKYAMDIYRGIDYPCYSVSSTEMNEAVKQKMIAILKDKTTLISGHSGSGKSTFVNALEPGLDLRTAEISETHLKGVHTTTFAEMHPLSFGGYIIDTPGIKEFGIVNMGKNEVYHFFPEIFKKASSCKFNTCLHLREPRCAVREAAEKGEIAPSRYHSYLSIMSGEEVVEKWDD